jgi:alpha-glucosidase
MFIKGTGQDFMEGVFASYPLKELSTHEFYSQKLVTKRADYIAHIAGTRNLPWRVLLIAAEDKELPVNDIVYKLAEPSRLKDVSWVHPGKCTDEWIINVNLFNVPFRAGINTATYKYYIDFAKRFGFDRIMMDAGWSDNNDLFKINPEINMDTLAAYAKSQHIKLSMWTLAETLDRQLESALNQFNKWGVDFIMTDFIDRDDQKAVDFYERIAKACAEHKIMIMYHGAYAPKGFNRTYPNAVTREGVMGSEYNIWSEKVSPQHDLILPFTRMLAGSFDYEPGFLNNATKPGFRNIEGAPMSFGTRCHQLAMFVVYDSPIQIFSGNPSQGNNEPDFMNLLGSIPTGWDETVVSDAKVGEYIITERKKNNDWFVGGLTDWVARDFQLKLDFLGDGNYIATICKDGINADKYAADYSITTVRVTKQSVIPIHLAPGGGFLLKFKKGN